jgi:hydroxyacylglutathione hydrolase
MPQAKAVIIPVTPFQQNCTLLWCEASKRAVVIDPGGDLPDIERAIAEAGVAVEKIWLTHGHLDHVGGAADLKARLNVPIEGPHRDDLFLLEHVVESARSFGVTGVKNVTPDRWLDEGDTVEVGELSFAVLHCPGHSPGSVAFINKAQRLAIVGDVLFAGSIGRTDLPGGDHAQLLKSIADTLGRRRHGDQRARAGHHHRPRTRQQSVSAIDGRFFADAANSRRFDLVGDLQLQPLHHVLQRGDLVFQPQHAHRQVLGQGLCGRRGRCRRNRRIHRPGKHDADFVVALPLHLGAELLPAQRDVEFEGFDGELRRLELQPRAGFGDLAHNAFDRAGAVVEIDVPVHQGLLSSFVAFLDHMEFHFPPRL